MDCNEVRHLLDQYIDKDLDKYEYNQVKEHISSCVECKAEYLFLKKYKKNIKSLSTAKAPDDFLEQLNRRIYKKSFLSKLVNLAFYPLKIKLPIETAGVLATVLLILIFFNPFVNIREGIQDIKAPEYAGNEIMKEQKAARLSTQKPAGQDMLTLKRKEEAAGTFTEARVKSGTIQNNNIKTYEIALIIGSSAESPVIYAGKAARLSSGDESPSVRGAASSKVSSRAIDDKAMLSSNKQKAAGVHETEEAVEPDKETAKPLSDLTGQRQPVPADHTIDEIEKIALSLNGRLLNKESNKKDQSPQPVRFLAAEIPAENKTEFVNQLKKLGLVKEEPVKQPDTKSANVILNINIIHKK